MTPYITVGDPLLVAYLEARGLTDEWASVQDQEAALVNGSDYIDLRFRVRQPSGLWASMFSGVPSGGISQFRQWPRDGAYNYYGYTLPDGTIPELIQYATIEAALRAGKEPGSLMPDYKPAYAPDGSGPIKSEREGDLAHEFVTDADDGSGMPITMPTIPAIMRLVAPLLTGAGATRYSSGIGMRLVT